MGCSWVVVAVITFVVVVVVVVVIIIIIIDLVVVLFLLVFGLCTSSTFYNVWSRLERFCRLERGSRAKELMVP